GEGDGQLGRDGRRSGCIEIVDEPGEQRAVEGQLEAQRPSQPQVVLGVAAKLAHRPVPPGQGCATARSPSMSTRAYSTAVEMVRWRRTSAISGRGTPALAIWQARVWRSRCARTIGTPALTQAQRTMPEIPFVPRGPTGATVRRNTSRCTVPFWRPLRRGAATPP